MKEIVWNTTLLKGKTNYMSISEDLGVLENDCLKLTGSSTSIQFESRGVLSYHVLISKERDKEPIGRIHFNSSFTKTTIILGNRQYTFNKSKYLTFNNSLVEVGEKQIEVKYSGSFQKGNISFAENSNLAFIGFYALKHNYHMHLAFIVIFIAALIIFTYKIFT